MDVKGVSQESLPIFILVIISDFSSTSSAQTFPLSSAPSWAKGQL